MDQKFKTVTGDHIMIQYDQCVQYDFTTTNAKESGMTAQEKFASRSSTTNKS